jgi:hypothetical protein
MKTNRINTMIDSSRKDAGDQVACLRRLLDTADTTDRQAMAVVALAAENTVRTVERLYKLNLDGIEHGLA